MSKWLSILVDKLLTFQHELNASIVLMNNALKEINKKNLDTEILCQLWEGYLKNADCNLEATGQKHGPI